MPRTPTRLTLFGSIKAEISSDLRTIARRIERGNDGEGCGYAESQWEQLKHQIQDLARQCVEMEKEYKEERRRERQEERQRIRENAKDSSSVSSVSSVANGGMQ
jgi:hypothetical protein